jgi:hypothetical protein
MRLKRMKDTYRALFASARMYRWTAALSAVLVLLMIALPLVRILPAIDGDPFIPLHYNIYFGVDQFGPWYYVFSIPGIGTALLLINLVFEGVYFRREHVLARFFATATLIAEIVLFVSTVFIVLLNI